MGRGTRRRFQVLQSLGSISSNLRTAHCGRALVLGVRCLQRIIAVRGFHAKSARFGFSPNGLEAARRLVRQVCGRGEARRDDTTSAPPHIISPSPSSPLPLHALPATIGTTAHPSCQLIRSCRLHALRSCALAEVCFPRPLLATTKLPAVLCIYYRGFRISKTTAEPQFNPPKTSLPHRPPIATSTIPNLIPNLKCFFCEDGRRVADREKPVLRRDGIPTGDRAQWAARARADSDCSP
jgi:hypothetical protein